MIRSTYALVLLVCAGLTLSACKKDDAASSTGAAAAASGTASAAPTASASATASAAPSGEASAAPSGEASAAPADSGTPAASGTPVANGPQRGIEDCCAALAGVATGGRGKRAKNRAFKALEICPQLAAMVRSGRATRQQALTQVRSGLDGHPAPASCH